MGFSLKSFTQSITKPIESAVSSVGEKFQQNVVDPVRETPQKLYDKAGNELIDPILQYPNKALAYTGAGLGGAASGLLSGAAPGLAAVTPSLGELITAYVDPSGYMARKSPFPTTTGYTDDPTITQQPFNPVLNTSPFNWPLILAAGLGGLALIFIMKKR